MQTDTKTKSKREKAYTHIHTLFHKHKFTGAALVVVGMVIFLTTAWAASTAVLLPQANGNYQAWTGAGHVTRVNEIVGSENCNGTGSMTSSTNNQQESYTIDLSTISNGATITSVDVHVFGRGDTVLGGTYKTFSRLNGTDLQAGSLIATTTNGGGCEPEVVQTLDVPDTVKSGATTLEIGMTKINGGGATNNSVRVGAIRAVVTYTAAAPTVTNVTSTTTNGSYKAGTVIPVSVTFDQAVTVTGTPQLTLSTGTPATTAINYASGSGTTTLIFNYTVAAGNTSADLDYSATTALALNGGTIKDTATGALSAVLTLVTPGAAGSLGANKAIVIDTTSPTVSGVTSSLADGSYKAAQVVPVQVNFSENVTVTGTPRLTLTTGTPATTNLNYSSGSGTSTLTFNYTVAAGNTSADLDYSATTALAPNGGTIRDAALNDATLTLVAPGTAGSLGANKAIVIDTTAPTVSGVTSSLADGSYTTAQVVPVQVNFSENVIVTGTPRITLTTGTPATTNINYSSGSGTSTLTFNYTVVAGNSSADLDYNATTALALNGGTIRDAATNNATLTLASPGAANSLGANKSLVIDTTAPTVTNITSSNSNGTYGTGAVVHINMTFSKSVNVTGTPQITLSTGTPATTAVNYTSGSGSGTLTFDYTVAAGNTSADLNYPLTTSLALNGGTIKDAATNNATLTLPAPGGAGSLGTNKNIVIDGIAPTVSNVTSTTGNGTWGASTLIPVTVTFSKTVNVTGIPQLTLSTGSPATTAVNYSSGTGTNTLTFNYTVAAGNSSADLDYSGTGALALNGGTILDGAGNGATLTLAAPGAAGSLGANKAIVIDTTVPTVTNVTSATADNSYKSGVTIPITVTFSESVTVTGTPQLSLSTGTPATTAVNYTSGSPGTTLTFNYTVAAGNTSADLDYANTSALALNGGTIKDTATGAKIASLTLAAPGAAGSLGANKALVIDTTNPSLSTVSIASNNANTVLAKEGDTVTLSITSSESIQTPTVNIKGSPASIAGGPTVWTASHVMAAGDSEGLVGFTIDYTDLAGNGGPQVTTTTPPSSVTYDRTLPIVTEITVVPTPSNNTTPGYTFDSTEAGNITYGGGCTSPTAVAVAFPAHNTVTFNALAQNTYNCTINITDASGNISGTLPMSTFVIDTTAPDVTLSSTALSNTNISPIPFRATFTEAVTGFDQTDITVGNGSVTSFTPDLATAPIGSIYDFEVTPLGQGLVTVDIAATKCKDLATNDNTAAVQLSRTYDNVQPSLVLSSLSPDPTNTAPIPFTATFSEPVNGFDLTDILVGNGSPANLVPAVGPSAVYTFDVTPTDPDPFGPNPFTVTADVAGGAAQDAALNDNTAASQITRSFDNKNPTVVISPTPTYSTTSPISLTATFSQDVTGFYDVPTDIVVSNGTVTNFTPVTGSVYTFDVTPTVILSGQETVTINIPAAVAVDAATNSNNSLTAAPWTTIYDPFAPSITAAQALDTNGDGKMDRIALTFDEAPADVVAGSNGFDLTTSSDHGTCNGESIDPDGVATTLNLDFVCTGTETAPAGLNLDLLTNAAIADAAGNWTASVTLTDASVPAITDGAIPLVVSTTPANAAVSVSADASLVVNFSEEMNPASFVVSDDDSNTYTGTVWTLPGNKTVTLTHNAWTLLAAVTATVDASDLSANSVNNAGTYGWSFTIGNGNNLGQINVATPLPVTDGAGSDFSLGVSTAAGGNILIDNVNQLLAAVTSKDLVADDLSLPQIVGDVSVTPLTAVTLNSTGIINVQNASLPGDTVAIPNNTTLFGCNTWDGVLNFKPGSNSGTAPTGFSVGASVYEVGSSSCPLLLDQPATITLTGVTGDVAYKPTGSTNWFTIPACGGTYALPTAPPAPVPFTECAISDGTNTKILTYHFTVFGPLVPVLPPAVVENQGTSGGYSPDAEKQALEKLGITAKETLHGAAEKVCSRNKSTSIPFTDLAGNSDTFYISDLFRKCAIEGNTRANFAPDEPITKAELARAVVVFFKLGIEPYIKLYDDVKGTDPDAPYLLKAAKLGLIGSESEKYMNLRLLTPNAKLSRAEALTMILKARGINLNDYDNKAVFADINANDWFYKSAAFAQNEKLMDFGTTFVNKGQVDKPYKFKRLLGLTDTGKDVENLKSIMMQLDYYSGEITNVYDRELADAVKAYQRANNIIPTGNMGKTTRAMLLKEYLHPKHVSVFRPNDLISRAEIAKLIYLVGNLTVNGEWIK